MKITRSVVKDRPGHPVAAPCTISGCSYGELDGLCDRLSALLKGVAIALNGPEPELTMWSWHDLPEKAQALADAIRAHRDQHGDDRCWQDDETLYKVLPEGYAAPARDTAVEIRNCERYIACRQHPNTTYVSPTALLKRYLDNHCANADAEGMSTLCECQVCLDTRAALFAPTSG